MGAAFGTYLLVRELRLGFWPGMVAGISLSLCAFKWSGSHIRFTELDSHRAPLTRASRTVTAEEGAAA